jgi:hypothetical protein
MMPAVHAALNVMTPPMEEIIHLVKSSVEVTIS